MPPVDNLEDLIDFLADRGAELTDPLIAACGMNNVRAIAKLLDRGARIDGNGRWSPLEEAIYFGNAASVALLLERGRASTTSAWPRRWEIWRRSRVASRSPAH